jgi:hypothetical protein
MGTVVIKTYVYMAAVTNPATIESTTVAESVLNYDEVSLSRTHEGGTAKRAIKVTSSAYVVKRMANMASKREAMDRTGTITGRG